MLYKITHYAGHVLVNTRPHQLCWGDWEMGAAISCTECSQMADFNRWADYWTLFIGGNKIIGPYSLWGNKIIGPYSLQGNKIIGPSPVVIVQVVMATDGCCQLIGHVNNLVPMATYRWHMSGLPQLLYL